MSEKSKASEKSISKEKKFQKLRLTTQLAFILMTSVAAVYSTISHLSLKTISLLVGANPFLALSTLISTQTFSKWLLVPLFFILITAFLGRFWCGWLCPLGTILELFALKPKIKNSLPSWLRSLKHVIWISTILLAAFGVQFFLIIDPITIFFRTFSTVFWPGIYYLLRFAEWAAYKIPFLKVFWSGFAQTAGISALTAINPSYPQSFLMGMILLIILSLNFIATRFWCRYMCPLGGLLSFVSRFSFFKLKSRGKCQGCGLCSKECPTEAIFLKDGLKIDYSECIFCLRCVEKCKKNDIGLVFSWKLVNGSDFQPEKRAFLGSFLASAFALSFFKLETDRKLADLLRPPGATEESLKMNCSRCGACVKVCPTGAIQPSFLEGGLEKLWTPKIVPSIGYCDYGCNRCGAVCPFNAIPALSIEEKQKIPIGKALVDKKKCLPWSQGKPCIVCEEACPVPEKAIELEERIIVNEKGEYMQVQVPVVHYCRCIGCGVCENKCPVEDGPAIKVYRKEFVKHEFGSRNND